MSVPKFQKDPEEIVVLTFDFTDELGAATISGAATVAVNVTHGADAAPANLLNGASSLDDGSKMVLQPIKAGTHGVDYRVKVRVDANDGRRLVLARTVAVRDANG